MYQPFVKQFQPKRFRDDGSCDFEAEVVFNVDMNASFSNSWRNGERLHGICGRFRDWAVVWVVCQRRSYNTMTDPDGDGIYSVSIT